MASDSPAAAKQASAAATPPRAASPKRTSTNPSRFSPRRAISPRKATPPSGKPVQRAKPFWARSNSREHSYDGKQPLRALPPEATTTDTDHTPTKAPPNGRRTSDDSPQPGAVRAEVVRQLEAALTEQMGENATAYTQVQLLQSELAGLERQVEAWRAHCEVLAEGLLLATNGELDNGQSFLSSGGSSAHANGGTAERPRAHSAGRSRQQPRAPPAHEPGRVADALAARPRKSTGGELFEARPPPGSGAASPPQPGSGRSSMSAAGSHAARRSSPHNARRLKEFRAALRALQARADEQRAHEAAWHGAPPPGWAGHSPPPGPYANGTPPPPDLARGTTSMRNDWLSHFADGVAGALSASIGVVERDGGAVSSRWAAASARTRAVNALSPARRPPYAGAAYAGGGPQQPPPADYHLGPQQPAHGGGPYGYGGGYAADPRLMPAGSPYAGAGGGHPYPGGGHAHHSAPYGIDGYHLGYA